MNTIMNPYKELDAGLTPVEFEKYCLEILQAYAEEEKLKDFHLEHNKKIQTHDGVYQIDIYAEFTVLNVQMRMLIECKKYSRSVGRDKIEILANRLQSCGAQKGLLISTSGFQSGAAQYAREHGIALWQIVNKNVNYIQNSLSSDSSEKMSSQLRLRSYLPKIIVYEYDDYDYPMHEIFPTKSLVERARKKFLGT